jgi:hypothetical protein
MNLEKGKLYHIFNQGNNHRKIFFDRDNYLFFLKKNKHIYFTLCRYFGLVLNAKSFSFINFGKK